MLEHKTFLVVKLDGAVTVLDDPPEGGEVLGEFTDLNAAIDEGRARALAAGAQFVDPPENLVGW